jgi:hypothetical protein
VPPANISALRTPTATSGESPSMVVLDGDGAPLSRRIHSEAVVDSPIVHTLDVGGSSGVSEKDGHLSGAVAYEEASHDSCFQVKRVHVCVLIRRYIIMVWRIFITPG